MTIHPKSVAGRNLAPGSRMGRLKAAGARTDGLNWLPDGTLVFRATNAHGKWTPEQIAQARQILGTDGAIP